MQMNYGKFIIKPEMGEYTVEAYHGYEDDDPMWTESVAEVRINRMTIDSADGVHLDARGASIEVSLQRSDSGLGDTSRIDLDHAGNEMGALPVEQV